MLFSKLFKKKDKIPHCAVVIVAAGSSLRMGGDKLMMELCHVPVLARTLLSFQQSELVDEIIVVTRMEKLLEVADICKKYGVTKVKKVIRGGTTRMESALAGVSEVLRGTRLIAIHDGARPLVTQDVIKRTVYAARDFYAAVPAIPSTDTLKNVEDERIIATLDRERIMRVQTPQVFDADLIKGALTVAATKALPITDDCSAIELMGVKVKAVEGDPNNIKLTTPNDVMLAEAILRDRGDEYADRTWL